MAAPSLPPGAGRSRRGGHRDRVLRAARDGGRGDVGQGPERPLPSRLVRDARRGLRRRLLIHQIRRSSGSPRTGDRDRRVGNLGHALANYKGFAARGFRVAALVDVDPTKIGERVGDLEIVHIDRLPELVRDERIAIGVIATPAEAVQAAGDRLVEAGIRLDPELRRPAERAAGGLGAVRGPGGRARDPRVLRTTEGGAGRRPEARRRGGVRSHPLKEEGLLLAIAAAIVALVLLSPVSCAGRRVRADERCENVMGLALPGSSYRGNDEYTIYLVPLAGWPSCPWRVAAHRMETAGGTTRRSTRSRGRTGRPGSSPRGG